MANFGSVLKNIKDMLKKELAILWIFSVLLGFALVVLADKNKLPLRTGDFVFISILALCVALYRPRWMFFLFVALAPLENIILASKFLPLQLRPFQFVGAILAAAIIILWIFKRLSFKLPKPSWLDWLVFSLVPLGFLSLLNAPSKSISLKNDLVLFSFVILYYLTRNFVRNKSDLIKTFFFFLGSNLVVLGYGFYQVFADKFGFRSFEVMFGRPNSVFTEADWLGVYLCFSLAVLLAAIFYLYQSKKNQLLVYVLVFLNLTLLVLTLSRSAWIGAAIVVFFFLIASLFGKEKDKTIFTSRRFADQLLMIVLISLISLAAIQFGKLSKFDLRDRARSAATSEQKITVACKSGNNVPATISSTDELAQYGCRFINLEEIDFYKSQGDFVSTVFRKDPNVMTRSQIYKKSFEVIRAHPVLGVGFGTITQSLGLDERGTGLNESNIFLQVWAGSGILGLAAFVIIIAIFFVYSFRRISPICPLNRFFGCPIVKDDFEKTLSVFIFLGLLALVVPNLFNAGLFMGIFWLGLAILVSALASFGKID